MTRNLEAKAFNIVRQNTKLYQKFEILIFGVCQNRDFFPFFSQDFSNQGYGGLH